MEVTRVGIIVKRWVLEGEETKMAVLHNVETHRP
jgi:hypothetical protein